MKFNTKKFKLLTLALASVLSISVLTGCSSSKSDVKKVGISQLVEHPALDETRKGFIEGLKKNGFEDGKNIEIDLQNAQGDIPTSQTIANKFTQDKKDLIFAIATPSAQAAKNATKDIPIVFTAVTDPVEAKLVENNKKPGGNVTGTSDFLDINKCIDTIQKVVPDAKKIGVAFNTSEVNSKVQVENLKREAKKRGLEVIDMGISSTNEMSQAISTLAKKTDVIFTPTDNLVASSMPVIVETAKKDKKPVIGSEEAHVQKGALAADSISYRALGEEAGEMAAKILKGEKAGELPVGFANKTRIVINEKSMKDLGMDLSNLENAEIVK